jgi:FkbM family methyltransferase
MKLNVLAETRHGKILYNKNDLIIGKSIALYGEWAQSEFDFIEQYIQPGDVCVDAGANIGTHTLFLAKTVGPNGFVFSFEMQRIPFQLLCANIALNDYLNVEACCFALSNQTGSVPVGLVDFESEYNYGQVSLKDTYQSYHSVPSVMLDSLKIERLDFFKIDVEGFECEVLEGSIDTIRRCKPLIYLEYHPKEQKESLLPFLSSLGYFVYVHFASFFNPLNFNSNPLDFSDGYKEPHIFCVHSSRKLHVNLERII